SAVCSKGSSSSLIKITGVSASSGADLRSCVISAPFMPVDAHRRGSHRGLHQAAPLTSLRRRTLIGAYVQKHAGRRRAWIRGSGRPPPPVHVKTRFHSQTPFASNRPTV